MLSKHDLFWIKEYSRGEIQSRAWTLNWCFDQNAKLFWHIWKNVCVGIIFNILKKLLGFPATSSKDMRKIAGEGERQRQRRYITTTTSFLTLRQFVMSPIHTVRWPCTPVTHTHIGTRTVIFPECIPRTTSYKTHMLWIHTLIFLEQLILGVNVFFICSCFPAMNLI